MSTKYTIIASIFAVMSGAVFSYKLNHYGVLISILSVVFFVWALLQHKKELKEQQQENTSGSAQVESYSTDEDTGLVIKSIGIAESGFIYFGDIVNDTNLPLKVINRALDYLVMNKLAVENKGRRGKAYELTPKGRDVLKNVINPTIKT